MEEEKGKKHIGIKIFCLLIIFIIAFYLYGRYIEPHTLKIKEVPIYNEQLSEDYNGFKIAHFSDLHYGRTTFEEELKKVVNELNKLNADIVIFTGDLMDNKKIDAKEQELLTKYFKKINAKLYKFAVIGDYDYAYLDTYKEILKSSDFTLLDNENALVYFESGTPINFVGLSNTNDINNLYNEALFNITLIHKPDDAASINNSELIFAGHSLGGQIKIPFIGGIKKINGAKTYLNDYYKIKNTDLYISNGIGTQYFSFRAFNPPSITLYRLYQS